MRENTWEEKELEDLCKKITVGHVGTMEKHYKGTGVTFLRSQNVKPFAIDLKNIRYIDSEFHAGLAKSELNPGDVVIVRTGYPGTAAVIPKTIKSANCSDLVIVKVKGDVDPRFIVAFFNSAYGMSLVGGSLVGVAQQHFNVGVAKKIKIKIPIHAEQIKICDAIEAYNNLIENNNRRIAILEDMAQSLYREWFVKFRFPGHEGYQFKDTALGRIPVGWGVVKFGDLVEFLRDSVKKGQVEENTPYMGLEHFPRKSLSLSEWDCVNEIGSSKLRFKKGDILFGKIRPYFHKVGVAQTDGLCSSDTFVWRAAEPEYASLIASVAFSDDFVAHSVQTSQGTKMPRASWDVLKDYDVITPPEALLGQFNLLVDGAIKEVGLLSAKKRNLKKQRDMLLPKLISGQIGV
jgi:type I restriction enzyme S subunit